MTSPQLLGQLGTTHQMLTGLIESNTEADCYRSFHPDLAPLAWYLGLCVYEETYWLREVIQGDADLTSRVRDLFTRQTLPTQEQCSQLPPKEHLLNWAMEIQDENLKRLATPGQLPEHQLFEHDRVLHHILQHHQRIFETMLMVLTQRQLQQKWHTHMVTRPIAPQAPILDTVAVPQGHYRIGAKDLASGFDNELPAQMVELSGFRIAKRPVSNAEYLSFMQDGGYAQQGYWSGDGWRWLQTSGVSHPDHWLADDSGNWFSIGLNGPVDLIAKEPVRGINQHEAQAYATWVAGQSGEHSGAVLQHEYQWEVAVRTQAACESGKVWEWCANPFHPYSDFEPSADSVLSDCKFSDGRMSLRGRSIYTQPALHRPSFRNHSPADHRHIFAGMRLVYPPKD